MDLPFGVSKAKAFDLKTIVAADLLSLTILEAPGTYGVDVVVGTTQRFGIPLGYGVHTRLILPPKQTTKETSLDASLGSKDQDGAPALRMALKPVNNTSKRPCHFKICTAQVLLAVMAGMYAVYHGPKGLKKIAKRRTFERRQTRKKIGRPGAHPTQQYYFDTLRVKINADA